MPKVITLGKSSKGFPIKGVEFGAGSKKIAFLGGIHGFAEYNTIILVQKLIKFFLRHPEKLKPQDMGLSATFAPLLNQDGVHHKKSRYNANEVDLNRNWECSWQKEPNAGDRPFSECETAYLRDFLDEFNAVIFFHSCVYKNRVVISGGQGKHVLSKIFGEKIAVEMGYSYVPQFYAHPINGLAIDYLASKGIMACDVEIPIVTQEGKTAIDLKSSLRCVEAVGRYIANIS